jgi:hypothetical protein
MRGFLGLFCDYEISRFQFAELASRHAQPNSGPVRHVILWIVKHNLEGFEGLIANVHIPSMQAI